MYLMYLMYLIYLLSLLYAKLFNYQALIIKQDLRQCKYFLYNNKIHLVKSFK